MSISGFTKIFNVVSDFRIPLYMWATLLSDSSTVCLKVHFAEMEIFEIRSKLAKVLTLWDCWSGRRPSQSVRVQTESQRSALLHSGPLSWFGLHQKTLGCISSREFAYLACFLLGAGRECTVDVSQSFLHKTAVYCSKMGLIREVKLEENEKLNSRRTKKLWRAAETMTIWNEST